VDLSYCVCDVSNTAAVLAPDVNVESTTAVCDSSCCNPFGGDKAWLNKRSVSSTEARR